MVVLTEEKLLVKSVSTKPTRFETSSETELFNTFPLSLSLTVPTIVKVAEEFASSAIVVENGLVKPDVIDVPLVNPVAVLPVFPLLLKVMLEISKSSDILILLPFPSSITSFTIKFETAVAASLCTFMV